MVRPNAFEPRSARIRTSGTVTLFLHRCPPGANKFLTFCDFLQHCRILYWMDLSACISSVSSMRFSSDPVALQSPGRLRSSNFHCVLPGTFPETWCIRSTISPPVRPSGAVDAGNHRSCLCTCSATGGRIDRSRLFTARLANRNAIVLADECSGAFSRMFSFVSARHAALLEIACTMFFLMTNLFLPQTTPLCTMLTGRLSLPHR